jgi:hypothetical protein
MRRQYTEVHLSPGEKTLEKQFPTNFGFGKRRDKFF